MKGQGTSIVNVKPGPAFLLALVLTLAPSLPVPERAQAIRLIHPAVEDRVDGNRLLTFEMGQPGRSAQIARQEMGKKAFPADGALRLLDEWNPEFVVGAYNLVPFQVIAPTLKWNTFLGSANDDRGYAITVDERGNAYVAGFSDNWGTDPISDHVGSEDAFVAKLSSSGILQWHTFMGSAGYDRAYGIVLDGSGNVYVAGYSDATWGSPINAHTGNDKNDAYVAKLNSSGVLQWHTFMGSTGIDVSRAIAVDGSGNAYVAGTSEGWGTPVNAHTGGGDAFAAKLNSNGMLQWHTFMGGPDVVDWDEGTAIAIDGSGNVYVTGYSDIWGTNPVNAHVGAFDAFVANLNSRDGTRQWHTFMGSEHADQGHAIVADGAGNIYIAGNSDATWGTPVNHHAGGWGDDAFVAKLNSSTGVRQWHTFLGSQVTDLSSGIAVDGAGNVYVAGESWATWGTPVNAHTGGVDAFVAKLNNSGARQWHTFLGSEVTDFGDAIALDGAGNVYVTGISQAAWGNPVNSYAGSSDALVAKIGAFVSYLPTILKDY